MPIMLSGSFDDDDDSIGSPPRAPRANLPHRVGDEQDGDNDWDFASVINGMTRVLIVPTDEREEAIAAGYVDDTANGHVHDRYERAMNLSVPGSDSMPSDIGSLHDLTTSVNAAARDEPLQERLLPGDQEGETRRKLYNNPIFVLLLATLVTSLLSNVCLFREMQSWHNTALRLEEKILQLELQQAKGHKEKEKEDPPVFSWENCGDSDDPEPTLLVDNCWLHAKAQLELGKCANEAKVTAKKKLEDFSKTVWKENKRFWNKVDDVGKSWIDFMAGDEYMADEPDTAKSESVPVEPKGDTNASGDAKSMDARTKKITDTAKTVASGLVYASLAFLVADESFSYFSGVPRERSGATSYM
jgi:hypothetical protein